MSVVAPFECLPVRWSVIKPLNDRRAVFLIGIGTSQFAICNSNVQNYDDRFDTLISRFQSINSLYRISMKQKLLKTRRSSSYLSINADTYTAMIVL